MRRGGWRAAVPVILLLCAWQAAYAAGMWSPYVLPSPQKVIGSLGRIAGSGELLRHVWVSMRRVLTGFSIAFWAAFFLGALFTLRPGTGRYWNPVLEFMRNVPPISLIALLILWFGIGETSKIIIIVLASFFPMFLNIKKGLGSCDRDLVEVGESLGFSCWRRFLLILLPAAAPDILVGMRIGLGYSWRAIIGAEMIAAGSGLGYLILDAQQMSRSDKVIAGILVTGIVGMVCDKLFSVIIKRAAGRFGDGEEGGVGHSWS